MRLAVRGTEHGHGEEEGSKGSLEDSHGRLVDGGEETSVGTHCVSSMTRDACEQRCLLKVVQEELHHEQKDAPAFGPGSDLAYAHVQLLLPRPPEQWTP